MSNNNVAVISLMAKFDEKSVEQAAKKLGKTTEEALSDIGQDKFGENIVNEFNKAMEIIKKKLKGVNVSSYTNNVLDSLFSKKDIQEKTKDLQNFISNITNLSKSLSGLGNSALNSMTTKQLDSIISKQKKVIEKEEEIAKKRKELESTARNIGNKSRNPSTISKNYLQSDYEQSYKYLEKLFSTEKGFTSEQQKSIKYLSEMLTLYSDMEKTEPGKGTSESIKYASDLLTVVKEINKVSKDIDLFTNGKASKFVNTNFDSTKKVNEYNPKLAQQDFVKAGLSALNAQKAKLEKDLTDYISNSVSKNLEKIVNETGKVIDKATDKSNKLQQKVETLQSLNNKPLINDIVDESQIKSLEEIEDRLYEIYDKDADGETTNKELKEFIQLYKQYEQLISKDNTVKFDPELKTEYEYLLKSSNSLQKYSDQLDNAIKKNKKISHEVKETNKIIEDQNNSVNSYNNFESDLKEIKDAISGVNDKIDSMNSSNSLENIENQLNTLDKKLISVSGDVDKLVDSFNLLSSFSLSDLQKTTLPLYNGINQVFKNNNGNHISSYWEDVKKQVEGSNVQLRELLKNVGLFNSESNGLKLISDGMENSGGIIGDDKVLIARKNHGKNYEEKLSLKQKLDEAYKSGINVSRILDVIGSKESDVIFDIQEKASGSILGNIYGQGEDFVNTEWLQASDKQIEKLISDLIELQNMGINVESNLTNIMYDKNKGFSFIDLDSNITNFDNNAELMRDHMIRIFGDLEDFCIEKNDSLNADFVTKARKRFENLSEQVQQAYAEAQDSHSPSKDFEKLENDAVEGIVVGANKNEDKLKNVGKQMAENIKEGFNEGIKNIVADEKSSSSITTLPSNESNISFGSASLINNQNNYQKELSETKKLTDDNVSSMFEFIKLCQEQAKALGETNEELKERAAYFKDEKISGGVSVGTHYVGNHDNSDINGANSDLHSHFSKYASFSENDLFNLKDTIKNFMVMGTNELTHFDTSGLSKDLLEQIWLRYDAAIKELNQQYFDNLNIKNNLKFTDIEDIPERILDKAFEFAENQSNVDYDYDKYDSFYNNQIEKIRQKLLEGASLNDITNSISDDIKSFDINGVESEIKTFQEKFTEGIRGYLTNILLENDVFNPDKLLGMQDYNISRNNALKSVLDNLGVGSDRLKTIDISNLEEGYSSLLKTLGLVVEKQNEVATAVSTDQKKDAFQGADANTKPKTKSDTSVMEQVEKATEEAAQAKKDFATANESVQSSIDGSENPLKLEAELMDQIAKSAREAADAKKEFVDANKQVKASADDSDSGMSKDDAEKQKVTYQELSDTIKRYSKVSERVAKGKSLDGDIDEITRLKEKISNLQKEPILSSTQIQESERQLTKLHDKISDIEKQIAKTNQQKADNDLLGIRDNATEKLSKYTNSSKYTPEFIERVGSKITEIGHLDITKPEDVARLKAIDSEIKEISDASQDLTNKLIKQGSKISEIISQMKIFKSQNTNMSSSQKQALDEMITYAEGLEKAGKTAGKEFDDLRASFSAFKADVAETGNMGKNFFSQIGSRLTDMNSKFVAQFLSWQDWIRYIQQGINTVRELDTALTEMRKVSDESLQSLKNYQNTTFDVADAVGTTAKQIQASTADYMRLGESLDEAAESAKTANVLLNVSEFDNIEDATKSLVAMGQAYKDLDKMTIVDKLNEVGKIIAQTYSNVWCYENIAW